MVILQNFIPDGIVRYYKYLKMKLRLLRTCCLLLLVTGFMCARSQDQTFDGCLSYDHLYTLHKGDVHSMGQMLAKQRFFMVSNENNVSFVHLNDTLQLNLCNWQFAQGFNDIYINAFYKEGFFNIVEYNTTPACAYKLLQECKEKYIEQYGVNAQIPVNRFIFPEGHHIVFPDIEKTENQYLIECYNPTDLEKLIRLSKTQQQQEQLARQLKEQTILRNIAEADSLILKGMYPAAISMLEEVYDLLPEYIVIIDTKLGTIKKKYKEQKIQAYTEQGERLYRAGDYDGALEYFSLVLKEDINNKEANERIAAITRKKDILHQRGQVTYEYRESNPGNYVDFRSVLEDELNKLVDNTPAGKLELDFSILFDTLGINQSYYNILSFNTISIEKNRPVLEERMTHLLGHSSLQPSFREDIPIRSATDFHIDMAWDSQVQTIIKNRKKIVNQSPFGLNPLIEDALRNRSMMYYGQYHFLTKNKTVNGQNYSDIQLTKYKTVGGEAFFYGLFPGLGTLIATQGKEGATCMALSLISYGGALTSYVFFNKFKKQYQESYETLSEKEAKNLKTKREVCKWSSIAGLGIGGTIQLGGMIKAMVRGIQNKKASKELRQALQNEPIEISRENIHLQ